MSIIPYTATSPARANRTIAIYPAMCAICYFFFNVSLILPNADDMIILPMMIAIPVMYLFIYLVF